MMDISHYYIGAFLGIVGIVVLLAPYLIATLIVNKVLIKWKRNKKMYRHINEDEVKDMIYGDHFWLYMLVYMFVAIFVSVPYYIKFMEIFAKLVMS